MTASRIKRFDDWPARLDRFLEERRGVPFAWGGQDCCLFACDAVLAMTGVDLGKDLRGSYETFRGAYQVLREKIGARSVGELADWIAELNGIREIPHLFAQRGDVVLLEREHGQSLGIVSLDGAEIWAPGEKNLISLPITVALRAWRI